MHRAAFACCLPFALAAQQPGPNWAAYVKTFDAYVAAESIVGASTWLIRDGKIVAKHEAGFGDRALNQRVDDNTIYHWGSITKTLTAIAVMQLVERGRLSLDARVTDYIPELRQVHDPYGSMDSITVRMLLSHSSGLQGPTWPWTQGLPWEPFEPTRWEQLVAMMPYQELAFKPGSKFSYSNPGFVYLARIVELITDDPWEAYVQKNIFAPLGLAHSYFNTTPYWLAAYRSNNYYWVKDSAGPVHLTTNGRDFDPGITIPNGGWNAPLGDLAIYLAFLTNATHGDTARTRLYETVLPHKTLVEMWKPLFQTEEGSRPGDQMGMSFFSSTPNGTSIVGHTGTQAGFRSFFYWDPATRAAVVAAFNTIDYADNAKYEAGFKVVRDASWEALR